MIRHAIQMTVLIIYGLERDNLKNNQVLTLEWIFFSKKEFVKARQDIAI